MQALQAKRIVIGLCVVRLLALPAAAEIHSVIFKTSANTKFF